MNIMIELTKFYLMLGVRCSVVMMAFAIGGGYMKNFSDLGIGEKLLKLTKNFIAMVTLWPIYLIAAVSRIREDNNV